MATYKPLQSIVLTATTSSVTFSGIDQGYTDLVLVVSNLTTTVAGQSIYMEFNGDSTAVYSETWLNGNGSSATSVRRTADIRGFLGGYGAGTSTTEPAMAIGHIMNYANTTTFKTALARYSLAGVETNTLANLWRSTAAINSIRVFTGSTMLAGSTFSLYGISPVNAKVASASGGTDIFYDSTYAYHVFKGTGTFTPNRALTADILVVAGGGGGGNKRGGGGGAGGVLAFASQSLTAGTSYTCTVGAGGAGGYVSNSAIPGTNGDNSSFGSISGIVYGGGGGAGQNSGGGGSGSGLAGGSGGGGTENTSYGLGTSGQGNDGGAGASNSGGGGGGKGGAGTSGNGSSYVGGNGGAGVNTVTNWSSLTGVVAATGLGVSGYIAGGGGAGANNGAGTGGSGGGGAGSITGSGYSGVTNTGSGGGGAMASSAYMGGNGGSGLVIVRYAR